MKIPPRLDGLSKRDLIRYILELESRIEQQDKRIADLEQHLLAYENAHTPSSKQIKKNTKSKDDFGKNDERRFPGRSKGHEGAGIKLPKPDIIEEHKIEGEGYVLVGKRVETVIEFVDKPLVVIQHIIYKYKAPDGSIVEPEVKLPSGFYGGNLQAFITMLKSLGISYENITDLLKMFREDISICPATALNKVTRIAERLTSVRETIQTNVKNGLYCCADETGLRHDGVNGYVWTFCNPYYALYETDLTRSGNVVERILGKDNKITIVSDGWKAYDGYNRQRCWPHLQRELDALALENEEAKTQAEYFNQVYKKALEAKQKPPNERTEFVQHYNSEFQIGYMIKALNRIKGCKQFAQKLENARPHLFTGVLQPEIPLDNNGAERILRKVVIIRKMIGCIRNQKGQKFINNTMSSIQTWHLQKQNPYQNLKAFTS